MSDNTQSSREMQARLAEDVAHVTFAMLEVLAEYSEETMAPARRNEVFDDTDFCELAGSAGLAFSNAFENYDTDQWLEIVDQFAREVVRHAVTTKTLAGQRKLAALAQASLRIALDRGIARLTELHA